MAQLRQETEQADADTKKKEIETKNPGHGYGGKFGIEKDRMDKSAMGHDYIGKGMIKIDIHQVNLFDIETV